MKSIYIFLIFIFIFNGCSRKNAFSNFDMDMHQQLSAQSFKRVKLINAQNIIGTFSAIYLNEIYPQRYNKSEYFLVSVYLKDSEKDYAIKLNSKEPLKIKELYHENRFSRLIKEKSKWSRYYLVSFEETGDSVNIELYIERLKKASIGYQKNTQ